MTARRIKSPGVLGELVDVTDIKTFGETNIFIDKLTQGAYIERRSTISNNGETPSWLFIKETTYRGKFFPRGCRGFIKRVEVYCRNLTEDDGLVYIVVGRRMGKGILTSSNIAVVAGSEAGWRGVDFNVPFMYDSLFIAVLAFLSDIVEVAYDAEASPDEFDSDDFYDWTSQDRRLWIRVFYEGQTVGDLPVSGIVGVVVLPNTVGDLKEVSWTNRDGGVTTTVLNIIRTSGKLTGLILHIKQVLGTVEASDVSLTWDVDGKTYTDTLDYYLKPFASVENVHAPLNFFKIDDVNHEYAFSLNVPIPFDKKVSLTVKNTAAAGNKIDIDRWYIYEKLI